MPRSWFQLFAALLVSIAVMPSFQVWGAPAFLAAGSAFSQAVMVDGNRAAWGDNAFGSLGDGSIFSQLFPLQIASSGDWLTLAAGGSHVLGIRGDEVDVTTNTLWAWGANSEGQLGLGSNTDQYVAQQVSAGSGHYWVDVSVGDAHTLAIRDDSTLWSWGWNLLGQLGTGDIEDSNVPVQVGLASNWSQVAAGSYFSLAINGLGELWAWGDNYNGQLGINSTVNQLTPTRVGTASNWVSVVAGDLHVLAVNANGELWAWGGNANGELGIGITYESIAVAFEDEPVRVGSEINWLKIAAGGSYSLAILGDGIVVDAGTLWSWGKNNDGQLGLSDLDGRIAPAQVGSASDWGEVAAGSRHSLAYKTDNTLYSWGSNGYGQLGRDSTDNWSSPQPVDLSAIPVVDGSQIYDPGAVDSDGDGIPDVYDALPDDSSHAANGDLDQNGLLEVADYQLAVRILLGKEVPIEVENEHLFFGDVAPLSENNDPVPDGEFTLGDAMMILRRVEQLTSW